MICFQGRTKAFVNIIICTRCSRVPAHFLSSCLIRVPRYSSSVGFNRRDVGPPLLFIRSVFRRCTYASEIRLKISSRGNQARRVRFFTKLLSPRETEINNSPSTFALSALIISRNTYHTLSSLSLISIVSNEYEIRIYCVNNTIDTRANEITLSTHFVLYIFKFQLFYSSYTDI